MAYSVRKVRLLESTDTSDAEKMLGSSTRVVALMILVGVLLMFLSLLYLHLSVNEAFISSLLERPLLSLVLAASAILVTYQIGLFVHFFLTQALWMGQNGWYFEKQPCSSA